jgi:hypothetical protein
MPNGKAPGRALSGTSAIMFKRLIIVRQTTMIVSCPTTHRPSRLSPSPWIWSCSPCGGTRSARWPSAAASRPSRGDGRSPAASCAPTRTCPPPRPGSWPRRPDCSPMTRRFRSRRTPPTSNSSPPMATRSGTPGCGWSASRIWRWRPTCPRPGPGVTPTVSAGPRSNRCSTRKGPSAGTRTWPPRSPSITPHPRGRRRARPLQDRVLLAGHRLLPPGVHGRRAAPGVRGGVGRGPGPAQLPPQSHRHPGIPGAHRRHDNPSGRASRSVVPGRGRHAAQSAHAAARGMTAGDTTTRQGVYVPTK